MTPLGSRLIETALPACKFIELSLSSLSRPSVRPSVSFCPEQRIQQQQQHPLKPHHCLGTVCSPSTRAESGAVATTTTTTMPAAVHFHGNSTIRLIPFHCVSYCCPSLLCPVRARRPAATNSVDMRAKVEPPRMMTLPGVPKVVSSVGALVSARGKDSCYGTGVSCASSTAHLTRRTKHNQFVSESLACFNSVARLIQL